MILFIGTVFPISEVKGCTFSSLPESLQKSQSCWFAATVSNHVNSAVQVRFRIVAALAFVPFDKVVEHFEQLSKNM